MEILPRLLTLLVSLCVLVVVVSSYLNSRKQLLSLRGSAINMNMPWKRVSNSDSLLYGGRDLDIIGEVLIFKPGSEVPYVVHYACGCKALIVLCSGRLHDFMPCSQHHERFRQLSYESASEIPSGN